MQYVFDTLGSILAVGVLLMTFLSVKSSISTVTQQANLELISQQQSVNIAELFDFDFSKAGYNKEAPNFKSGNIDSSQIYFYTDLDNDGDVDSIHYFISDSTALSHTPHPSDFILYRKLNDNTPQIAATGVTEFEISYIDSSMSDISTILLNTLLNINSIRGVTIKITIESPYAYESNGLAGISWQKTFMPVNLRN